MLESILASENTNIETIRSKSIHFLGAFVLLQIPIVWLAAFTAQNDAVLFLGFSILLGAVAFLTSRQQNTLLAGNMIAVTLMGQVCLIVAALKGHPYQIDVHMYFFALMGMLAALLSVSAIILATLTVAIHHLFVYLFVPEFVFPGESTYWRVGLHAIILICESVVLLWLIFLVNSAFKATLKKKNEAEQALDLANAADKKRIEAEEQAKAERKQVMTKISTDFHESIVQTVEDVKAVVQQSLLTFEGMFERANDSKGLSEQASSAVSDTTKQTSSVAAATEELNAAIGEISSQAHKASSGTNNAADEAENAMKVVERLEEASSSIGEIISFISGIAGQINLLALNATIESARAGEAGKGFAVVAGEVKTLAGQTEKATQDITERIGTMESVSHEVSKSMQNILSVIRDINAISTSIASAVEEQSTATREISSLIQKVSSSAGQVNENVIQLNQGVVETSNETSNLGESFRALQQRVDKLDQDANKFIEALQNS